MGLVTPVGNDVASTWAALVAGESGAGPITKFDSAQLPVHFACEVKGYDALQYIDKKRSEEHTSELQSLAYLVCRLLLEKKKKKKEPINRCQVRDNKGRRKHKVIW